MVVVVELNSLKSVHGHSGTVVNPLACEMNSTVVSPCVSSVASACGSKHLHLSLQDSKAINMFGLESMLKDDWSGYYSQGYMYSDNCSSLFLPKVCSTLV